VNHGQPAESDDLDSKWSGNSSFFCWVTVPKLTMVFSSVAFLYYLLVSS